MSIQRIHSGWNQKGKKRQISQVASALAVSIWKISKKTLLNLENEGFDTDTWADRLEILKSNNNSHLRNTISDRVGSNVSPLRYNSKIE